MRSHERTDAAGRARRGALVAFLAAGALTAAGCGSTTTTATAPSTTASTASVVETTSTEEPPVTETPGAVSGAAALGGASGRGDREDGDASTLEDDGTTDDTTDDGTTDDTTDAEGILAETGADEVAADVTWSTSAIDFRGQEYLLVAYECPPDGTLGTVWGTAAYTDDSSVCTAAVHVGLISEVDGGVVVIQISDGLDAYEGSTANGVTTGSYGSWDGTFTFVS